MNNAPFVSAVRLSKRFGGVQALRDVSVDIARGEVHALVGENGCGKSTLIKMVCGVERPSSGAIVVDGVSHQAMSPHQAVAAGIEVIYQDLSLFPNLTVAENIAVAPLLALGRRVYSPAEARRVAAAAMDRLGVSLDLSARLADLPVGARQQVAICRALSEKAHLIIMDEPTTALRRPEVEALFRVIRRVADSGVGIVFVSHKLEEVLEIADTITVMRNGEVVGTEPVSAFDRPRLSRMVTGRELKPLERGERIERNGKPSLEIDHLSSAGGFEDVTLAVEQGEVVGLAGLLGSGNAELGEALFGLRPTSGGGVRIDGVAERIRSVHDALELGIGYVPGDRMSQGLFMPQSLWLNLTAANIDHEGSRGLISRRKLAAAARNMISELQIKTPSEQVTPNELSGGNQQRVLLGKWLLRRSRILITNGPTVGVDVGSKREILQILLDVAARGTSVLVISDDTSELVQVCERVVVMRGGRLVDELSGSSLTEAAIIGEVSAA
jgi:simple sugar transport system ATP-binding protein